MPEIGAIQILLAVAFAAAGAAIAWVLRGRRAEMEKNAVSAGWQEQISAQQTEHERLAEQNKGLMEQISQYQASNIDVKNRVKEVSAALAESNDKREQLQREIRDIRSNLEQSVNEREQLMSERGQQGSTIADDAKDARIARLESELEKWQQRLPPLVDKFRERNEQVEQLEQELLVAEQRISELELASSVGSTGIEPVQYPDELTDGRDASNEPLEESQHVNGSRDRLQAIKGVGPAIEKTLNEMGIFRYQQIAEMSEYEIDRVANRLKGFRSRIYREDWIGQARELRDQEIGD